MELQNVVKHTPGPWAINDHSKDEECIYIEAVRDGVASIFTDFANALANAHLIAAAPELLEALEDLFNECTAAGHDKDKDFGWPARMGAARAAIAKARGAQ